MTDTEIVHKFRLAEQEGYGKRFMVCNTIDKFFVMKVGRPCGNAPEAEFNDVDSLLMWIRNTPK